MALVPVARNIADLAALPGDKPSGMCFIGPAGFGGQNDVQGQ